MDKRQTALIAEREGGERRHFPSQEVAQLSADFYLKCRKKRAERRNEEARCGGGKDHSNISAF